MTITLNTKTLATKHPNSTFANEFGVLTTDATILGVKIILHLKLLP